MKGNNQKVMVDSGFWIALYSPEKEPENNEEANEVLDLIEESIICVPWPTMYEFVNSKLGRRKDKFNQFEKVLKSPSVFKVNDAKYKELALQNLFASRSVEDISLVDEVIKLMLTDESLKIDYFVSFDIALSNFAAANGVNINLK